MLKNVSYDFYQLIITVHMALLYLIPIINTSYDIPLWPGAPYLS